jgi:hypothetical protein
MITNAQHEVQRLQTILKYSYGLVPIAAGADKFINLLTNWSDLVPSGLAGLLPFAPHTFPGRHSRAYSPHARCIRGRRLACADRTRAALQWASSRRGRP